jgi:hypothetical protein
MIVTADLQKAGDGTWRVGEYSWEFSAGSEP